MENKKWYWLVFLTITVILHWFAMPDVILNDHSGGSCYQGITRVITHFVFKVCLALSFTSFLMVMWKKENMAIFTGITAAGIWTLLSIALIRGYGIYGFLYVFPFLLYNFMFAYYLIKNRKSNQNQNI